ncbi:hypothetical protein NSQ54_17085 [Alkalihalobacillus sp. FSL W8-0930]
MSKHKRLYSHLLLFVICAFLLAACSSEGQSEVTKSKPEKGEPVEVKEDQDEEAEAVPVEENIEIEIDSADELVTSAGSSDEVEETNIKEEEDTSTTEASESNDVDEELVDVEMTEADSSEDDTESTEPEDAGTIQSEPGYEGWVDGKGLPWKEYFGSDLGVDIDPETKFSDITIQSVSSPFKYAPLKAEGVCWAEYCMSADELPETAFIAADGYIYDMDYAGTWEYHFELDDPWIFYAWNFE